MKRFGTCAMTVVFAFSLWAMPAGAQDKFILGMGGST